MIVKAGGPRCGCGARGCMEALASKTAIARRVDKAVRKGLPTVLADKMAKKGGRLKSGDLAEAVAGKDLVALKEVQRAAHFLGIGLGSLINVFGPEIVVVGGGVPGRSATATSGSSELQRAPRSSPIPRESSVSNERPWAITPEFRRRSWLATSFRMFESSPWSPRCPGVPHWLARLAHRLGPSAMINGSFRWK